MITVAVVDDQALVREGLALILGTRPGIEVTEQYGCGEDLLRQDTDVDVVLLDLYLPGIDGLEVLRRLRRSPGRRPRVLMLTTVGRQHEIRQALAAGADGFVLKDSTGDELVAAVRAAADGLTAMSASATAALTGTPEEPLTPRERDVLRLLGEGLSNREIAGRLRLAERTVKVHVGNLLAKLGVSTRTQAALLARAEGPLRR
ncbi:response regulator transcription factor [Amycolatopsis rhizosphaerae]|uniref:Response regulator transcription factor n=1 Tax=Amycolatopsis rhizosphaerae TaxID=2053003 RepID=A0A558BM06_9PSEU|nr:response regulator transcription factor [Amycolatopsis rhizosphaerae]TVT37547.1 response regulator transcription factor [Amycolatopsis rhizosphaerae]